MKIVDFLSRLRSLDIHLFIEGDRLRCNAPEGVLTPELRAELSDHKAEILTFLKAANPTQNYSIPLLPLSRQRPLPTSFAQQRLWFLDRLVPNNPFYNMPAVVRLRGVLNLTALEKAFQEIGQRHEALRTTFSEVEGQPIQNIHSEFNSPIAKWDLRSLPPSAREIEAQRLMTQEAKRPFNLSIGPLLRVTLLQFSESEHLLMLNMHHIVSDGWSIGVLIQEVGTLYTAFVTETSATLPKLSIQYADFSNWQRKWLQGAILKHQLAYWRQQLDGISQLNLPIDRPRPALPTYQGKRQALQLPKQLSEDLESLSQREGVTLFMTLLTAFQILLYRYTQQEDIAVGSPIANRNRSEIEPLIGFFVNSLVLRTDLSGNPTFLEVLQRVKKIALEAYAHQDVPFEKLVEELHPERSLNQNPLFQVVFALQNAPMEALELPGLTLSPQELEAGTARFDLEFHLWERSPNNQLWVNSSQGIGGFVVYNTDLFEAATIERMLGHFQTLLESIVANPHQTISTLPLLRATEKYQLLVEWNQTETEYPKKLCVHQLFEIQAEQNPDAIALVWGDRQLTYRELNLQSNQLAHSLLEKGVQTETVVGLCLERSLDLVIAMLGIWKAGGVYLPLDPTYPQERLHFIIEEARLSFLITHRQLQSLFQPENLKSSPIIITLNEERHSNYLPNPISHLTAKSLAYIIYTSGSTGKPKGVAIEQGSLLNLIFWHQKQFALSSRDRATQIAGMAFDACGWEIWPYLTAGATLYFADEEIKRSPEKLRDWLISQGITVSFLPTPLAEKVLQCQWPSQTALRILLTGGEALRLSPLASHPFQVVNNYGPTEGTVVTTSGLVPVSDSRTAPSLGRPIANTRVYILDPQLQPVPIGITGELYISGDGIMRGYLNRPDLNAVCLIPNPFQPEAEELIYKTGDLVRYRSNGNLEFIDRLDRQVKIRGFRIELGEIETVLAQHPTIQQTVVLPWKDSQGDNRLVAYCSLHPEFSKQGEEEQKQLQQEQIWQWQMLYNETYKQSPIDGDPTFNIIGWNSSYTNQPIPPDQMREWVDGQVAEILKLKPKSILEIGCGMGLLLFRLAPHCTHYCGTDFSPTSLNYLRQNLENRGLTHVTLLEKMATDFAGIEKGVFDVILLNSIIQYFPNVEYLLQVLEGAIQATVPGGSIFLGDVRSLPLLEAFHTTVELEKADPSLSCQQLRERVKMQVFQEPELAIDPAFFQALKERFPQISSVRIQLIRGQSQNELTQFRYNAILYISADNDSPSQANLTPEESLDWSAFQDTWTLDRVRQKLVENQPQIFRIFNVPNARILASVKTTELLMNSETLKTVGQLRKAVAEISPLGIDPEVWYDWDIPYQVFLSWSHPDREGQYQVVFVREDIKGCVQLEETIDRARPWDSYTNNPLQAKAARTLVPILQTYLTEKLPDYMMPSAFMVLESLPLTANGKIDRHALPTPDIISLESVRNYVAPRTPIEENLTKIWSEVLGVKRVGMQDNFFELGGHSLLATQLVSRVRNAFGVELPLRKIFEAPTPMELLKVLEVLKDNKAINQAPALVPLSRESRRRKLSSLNSENQKS